MRSSVSIMNKQGVMELTEDGHRTTGIRMFFDSLPDHIRPMQKSIPPYMPYKEGHGYLGVLLVDTDTDRVQCHLCGRWYKMVNGKHLEKIHKLTSVEYKEKVGLYKSEPLMSYKTLSKFRTTNRNKSRKNLTNGPRFRKGGRNGNNEGSKTIQFKNRYGTCDAQLKFRLDELILKYGRVPTTEEAGALAHTFARRYGNWTRALEIYELKPYLGVRAVYNPETDLKIAPSCQICGTAIVRKRMPAGDLEDRERWLNKKTCSPEHLEQYLTIKYPVQSCKIENCQNKYSARGFCNSHYLQFVKSDRKHTMTV